MKDQTRNLHSIKGAIDKRAQVLYSKWKEQNPMFFTDNGYKPCYERFRLNALLEYLESAD